jgi:hypothetical protein
MNSLPTAATQPLSQGIGAETKLQGLLPGEHPALALGQFVE